MCESAFGVSSERVRKTEGPGKWLASCRQLRVRLVAMLGPCESICIISIKQVYLLTTESSSSAVRTRPEESYRLWCVVVCDTENLMNEEVLAHWGAVAPEL
jgi:hypothetical protein